MIFLLLSILTNAALYSIFKMFDRFQVQTLPAIVVNYFIAFIIGICFVPDLQCALSSAVEFPIWTTGALLLGIVFIFVFNLTGTTARKLGVSVTTIASKMSLALAVMLFVWIDPAEKMSMVKLLAIILALVGVYLSSIKDIGAKLQMGSLMLPALILLGGTTIDFGIAYFSSFPANENELKLYSCLSFGMAGLCGAILMTYQLIRGMIKVTMRDFVGGAVLGTVNYGSILFLVLSYDAGIMQKSELLPVNNLGVVLVSAFSAVLFFKEKLTSYNWLGLALSVIALVLLL